MCAQPLVRTSPYYPQSNGKIERWHKSLRGECIRPGTPLSLEDARRLVNGYVEHYNNVRLNSAIGYITPKDMLAGHQQKIQAKRDRKLEAGGNSGRIAASGPRARKRCAARNSLEWQQGLCPNMQRNISRGRTPERTRTESKRAPEAIQRRSVSSGADWGGQKQHSGSADGRLLSG